MRRGRLSNIAAPARQSPCPLPRRRRRAADPHPPPSVEDSVPASVGVPPSGASGGSGCSQMFR